MKHGANRRPCGRRQGPSQLGNREFGVTTVNAQGVACSAARSKLIVYERQVEPLPETPAIYSKLPGCRQGRSVVRRPNATVPTDRPIMPLVQAARPVVDGELLVPGEQQGWPTTCGSTMRRGDRPTAGRRRFLDLGQKAGGNSVALARGGPGISPQKPGGDREGCRQENANMPVVFDPRAYPPNTVEFSSILRALNARPSPTSSMSRPYPPDSAGILRRPVNEIGIGGQRQDFSAAGMVGPANSPAVMDNLGFAAQRPVRQLQHLAA